MSTTSPSTATAAESDGGLASRAVGGLPAWLASLLIHLAVLVVVSLISVGSSRVAPPLILTTPVDLNPDPESLVAQEFHFEVEEKPTIGASAMGGLDADLPAQVLEQHPPEVPSLDLKPAEVGQFRFHEASAVSTGVQAEVARSIKGAAGVGTTGTEGAVDRITQEILLSLEERPTLVVWFFDQSGSLSSQRDEVHRRFHRIYEELGIIQQSEHELAEELRGEPILLTSIVAFGEQVTWLTKRPTDDLDALKKLVHSIERDESGVEMVFTAIHQAAIQCRKYRSINPETGGPERNVLFVVFTDEAGDDQDQLDTTVNLCRRLAIPTYVVGVPAPFGRRETLVKWVDPDPKFDQSPQWGRVDQGPESLLPERIRIHFARTQMDDAPIDSGFGPFALTRLCYETGGIYFAVHPNRRTDRVVRRRDTQAYSAYIQAFFEPDAMRRYRPDYVSAKEYMRRVESSQSRKSLVEAAQASWLAPMEQPQYRFEVRDEARLAAELTEAQKGAARLEPAINALHEILKQGEAARAQETVPRWQAGYDLAMGRVLAIKVRTEAYNAMLAKLKRGMKFTDEKNNVWELKPSDDVSVGSQLKGQADAARVYLQRVVQQHPGTPWAMLAARELHEPFGWEWKESYTPPPQPPANQVAGNNNNDPPRPGRDDQVRRLEVPPVRRPPPKL